MFIVQHKCGSHDAREHRHAECKDTKSGLAVLPDEVAQPSEVDAVLR